MIEEICPCKDCVPPIRHAGCHGECPAYKKWNEAHRQNLAKIREIYRAEDDCFPNRFRGGKKRRRMR